MYVAVGTSSHAGTISDFCTAECSTPTSIGTATGSATSSFVPSLGDCNWFGYPAEYTFSGAWDLTVTSGPDGSGSYYARVDIPAGSTVTADVPIVGCAVANSGPQSFASGSNGNVIRLRSVVGGVEAEATVFGIVHTSTGCPFSSGSDGSYSTNGVVTFPGVTIS